MLSTTLQAGKLRQSIMIVQVTPGQDPMGEPLTAYSLVATVRASVESLAGRELFAAQQTVAEVTHKVTIRWMPGIKAKQKVWFDSREFEIQAVSNPNEVHKLLVLLCLERDDSEREGAGGAAGALPIPITTPIKFATDGVTNVFTLPYSPTQGILLWWNGLLQSAGDDYTLSGPNITMTRTPAAGENLIAMIF